MPDRLTQVAVWVLDAAARLLPPRRRPWAEALGAEAGEVRPGWPRLAWLAGGLWLIAREAGMIRRIGYWIGVAAVAAAAAWAVWLSWRTAPSADPESVTDRIRLLAGAAALVALPWAARRRGLFGPVGGSVVARLVRVAGCAAICAMGVQLVRSDSHGGINGVLGSGHVSWLREIPGLAALIASVAVPLVVMARRPGTERGRLWVILACTAIPALVLVPLQAIIVGYAALILAATSRRSPLAPATLAIGVIAGLPAALAYLAVTVVSGNLYSGMLAVLVILLLAGGVAGAAAAWRVTTTGGPDELRSARTTQGLLAGAAAGAVAGLIPTAIIVIMGGIMVLGPLAGMAGAAIGAAAAADRRDRTVAASAAAR